MFYKIIQLINVKKKELISWN